MSRLIMAYDENNNEVRNVEPHPKKSFIERRLVLGGHDEFLIVPNGGSGDCMFKAVSQAVNDGDESRHKLVRKKVVDFITKERWSKFKEYVEVQHINGNNLLQRHWAKDAKEAYKMYMSLDGTLGASAELTAAGELFRYNFVTIQEYCSGTARTYRVENCILFEGNQAQFHYFYFTGDYDNGHWEYLKNLSNIKIQDGTYNGLHKIMIENEEISMEEWLQRETENDNDADRLKFATNRAHYLRQKSDFPFEASLFAFNADHTVTLNKGRYAIADTESTDLFSVLAQECLQNEGVAHEAEMILLKHRYSYFEDINYKLITQPYSHNFTVSAIRYCGHPVKGNIQDLIGAADLYSFSFVLFLKLDKVSESVHQCKFTHVDRWGGESDRTLYFFMRLVESQVSDSLNARWWRLIPQDENGNFPREEQVAMSVLKINERGNVKSRSAKSSLDVGVMREKKIRRPISAGLSRSFSKTSCAKALTIKTRSRLSIDDGRVALGDAVVVEPSESNGIQEIEDGMDTDECCRRDREKIFGSFTDTVTSVTKTDLKRASTQSKLVKKRLPQEKIKPATGKDLREHPEKVKTLVRLSDRSHQGRQITYAGSGVLKADDVLDELKLKGLIKIPLGPKSTSSLVIPHSRFNSNERGLNNMFLTLEKRHRDYDKLRKLRDENFITMLEKEVVDDDESDVSYESFVVEVKSNPDNTLLKHGEPHLGVGGPLPDRKDNPPALNVKKSKVAPILIESSRSSSRDWNVTDECVVCFGRFREILLRFYRRMLITSARTKKTISFRLQKWRSASRSNLRNVSVRLGHMRQKMKDSSLFKKIERFKMKDEDESV